MRMKNVTNTMTRVTVITSNQKPVTVCHLARWIARNRTECRDAAIAYAMRQTVTPGSFHPANVYPKIMVFTPVCVPCSAHFCGSARVPHGHGVVTRSRGRIFNVRYIS